MTQPTNYRAALEQALDALRSAKPTMWRHAPGGDYDRFDAAMTGIRAALTAGRAALSQPQGEAIATVCKDGGKMQIEFIGDIPEGATVRLYTHPQASEPVPEIGFNGLTEAETSDTMSVLGLSKPTEPAPKGLFIDMIAEHGPEFVAEMASIGEPAPSFERLPKEYEKILHDNAWDLYETGSAEPASSTNDVKQETSEWLSEEYGAAPSTAGERHPLLQRATELHENAEMPWADAEKLALSEAGIEDGDIEELIHEHASYILATFSDGWEDLREYTRALLVHAALLQSTALPDHSEQHLDMVAALPVGDLTDSRIFSIQHDVQWSKGGFTPLKFARAILAAARSQPVLEPLTEEQIAESILAADRAQWLADNFDSSHDHFNEALDKLRAYAKLIRDLLAAHGITQGGKV